MKRLLALTALLTASMVVGTSVQAAGYGVSWGNTNNYNSHGNYNTRGYNNYGSSYSNNYGSGYNNGYQSNYGSYPSTGYNRSFHDTSHYDYHQPTVQRHGGHLDYTPGHYDLHRTGHNH